MIKINPQRKPHDFTEVIFSFLAMIVLALIWFQWDAVTVLSVFLMLPYYAIIAIIVTGMIITSIIMLIIKRKNKPFARAFIPLLITIILIIAIFKIPFTELYLKLDFETKIEGRNEVVYLIETGEIKFEKQQGRVPLPQKYSSLSKEGDVLINIRDENTKILFFTFSGVLDNFSGYIYVSSGLETDVQGLLPENDFNEVTRISDYWFWVASN